MYCANANAEGNAHVEHLKNLNRIAGAAIDPRKSDPGDVIEEVGRRSHLQGLFARGDFGFGGGLQGSEQGNIPIEAPHDIVNAGVRSNHCVEAAWPSVVRREQI